MDYNWITEQIALGGMLPENFSDALRGAGISAVIDLRVEAKDDESLLHQYGIAFLHIPTEDLCASSQGMLWEGVKFARMQLEFGRKLLVHCQHGIGRSPVLACCILVSFGHSPLAALMLVKNAREKVSPSPEQLHAYLRWCDDWFASSQITCPPTPWDDLAAIAYRHLRSSP